MNFHIRNLLLAAGVAASFATVSVGVYAVAATQAGTGHFSEKLSLQADEGVPQNLVTAMKSDEGVPQNLVTSLKSDEGVPQNLVTSLKSDEGVPQNLVALKADEGVPQNLVTG